MIKRFFDIVVSFLLSIISPFPFWGNIKSGYSPLLEGIGNLILIYFWVFSMIALLSSNIRSKIDKNLIIIFCIFIFYYIIIAYMQPLHRRLMLVYPFVIMFGFIALSHLDNKSKKIVYIATTVTLIFLYILYFLIKLR